MPFIISSNVRFWSDFKIFDTDDVGGGYETNLYNGTCE